MADVPTPYLSGTAAVNPGAREDPRRIHDSGGLPFRGWEEKFEPMALGDAHATTRSLPRSLLTRECA